MVDKKRRLIEICPGGWGFPVLLAVTAVGVSGCRERAEAPSRRPTTDRARRQQVEWQRSSRSTSGPATSPTSQNARSGGDASTTQATTRPMCVLAQARPGQWAKYRFAGGFEQRLEVVTKDDRQVSLKLEMWLDGKSAGLPTIRTEPTDTDWALRAAARVKADLTIRHTSLNVAGRTWQTRLTLARWTYERVRYERRTWMASDAPIYGLVRMIQTADDRLDTSMELVAFGDASDRTNPPE